MTVQELKDLKVGDVVYCLINLGTTGIGKYQYLGIFTDHSEYKETKHLFISEMFLSTRCIVVGKEKNSLSIKRLFLTEKEAQDRKKELLLQDQEY